MMRKEEMEEEDREIIGGGPEMKWRRLMKARKRLWW